MDASVAEVLVAEPCELGEGPLWDAERERVLWIDIPRHRLHAFHVADGRHHRYPLAQRVSCVASARDGLVVAGDGEVRLCDAEGGTTARLAGLPLAEGTRTNDGACDPHGRLWVGTADTEVDTMRGALFRVHDDGRVDVMRDGLSMSNGIDWSPDGSRCYHVDTRAHRIDELLLDGSGDIAAVRPFATVEGMPDGLAVDADGGVWVAVWDGHAVHRYLPSGRLDEVVPIPARFVTSCVFGAAGTGELFVTTAAGPAPQAHDHYPMSGALFRVGVGVDGQEPRSFGT